MLISFNLLIMYTVKKFANVKSFLQSLGKSLCEFPRTSPFSTDLFCITLYLLHIGWFSVSLRMITRSVWKHSSLHEMPSIKSGYTVCSVTWHVASRLFFFFLSSVFCGVVKLPWAWLLFPLGFECPSCWSSSLFRNVLLMSCLAWVQMSQSVFCIQAAWLMTIFHKSFYLQLTMIMEFL